MRKEGGAKRQDGNSIPTAFSLHQDTPRYPALPLCAIICPLWGLFIQVISSLASSFLETAADAPDILSKARQRSKKIASQ